MAADTRIEWCHATFNPWRGCTKVSQGCKHCYAETMSGRNPRTLGEWGPRGTRVIAAESYWRQPVKWNAEAQAAGERRRVFCASLADVFESADTMPPDAWGPVEVARERLFHLIEQTPALDWLLLTKRPENIPYMAPPWWYQEGWPANVWIGTSVENQEAADERIPYLLRVPARVRFLSCEPLLGPLDLSSYLVPQWYSEDRPAPKGIGFPETVQAARLRPRVDWVIVGGESGPKARPMHPNWAVSLRDQCMIAGVAFHFKQWGEYRLWSEKADGLHLGEWVIVKPNGAIHYGWKGFTNPNPAHVATAPQGSVCLARVGKKAAGRLLDGQEHNAVPAPAPYTPL